MIWIFLLISLTSSVCEMFPVKMSQTFYQTENNITVTWDTQTKTDLSFTNLICFFQSEPLTVLYHMIKGVEYPQSEQFAGRVQLDRDALREGHIRLHLSTLTAEDSGNYWCDLAANYDKNTRRWGLEASEHFVLNVAQNKDDGDNSETKSGTTTTTGEKLSPGRPQQEAFGEFLTPVASLFLAVVIVCFGLVVSGCHQILIAHICGDK